MKDHDDGHSHPRGDERPELSGYEKRTDAIMALLIEKGIVSADDVRRQIEDMDSRTPAQGARVVARAWVDRSYRERLLTDGNAAIAELGIQPTSLRLVAVQNSPTVHHVVVCTLCSCYPRGLLGLPPDWYKSLVYRSRAVADPRGVLGEFGLRLDDGVEVRVLDSTADVRYLVIPERPPGTEGMREEALASLVTRDSMIGVARARTPARAG